VNFRHTRTVRGGTTDRTGPKVTVEAYSASLFGGPVT
jgi:hypothetical protein